MSSRGRGRGRKRWGDNGFEAWGGYMAAKKSKLEEQFLNDADKEPGSVGKQGGIFEGVAIFVNGYTGNRSQNRLFFIHQAWTKKVIIIIAHNCRSFG